MMDTNRILSELTSIRQKYILAIYEAEKAKEKVNSLELENKELVVKCANLQLRIDECEKLHHLKYSKTENDKLVAKCSDLQLQIERIESKQQNVTSSDKCKQMDTQNCQLKKHNQMLEARLKQAEYGIEQKRRYNLRAESRQDSNDDNEDEVDFEVEKLLNHKKNGKQMTFLVRWKGYDESFDTWEPESYLRCPKILATYKKKNKI